MKINGWQRIWVVVSVAWAAMTIWFLGHEDVDTSDTSTLWMVGAVIGPPMMLYVSGWMIGWILRGFLPPDAK